MLLEQFSLAPPVVDVAAPITCSRKRCPTMRATKRGLQVETNVTYRYLNDIDTSCPS